MASTVQSPANLASVMKQVWTSDRLEKQFYDEAKLLNRLERTNRYTIGEVAKVPIHKGRSGGYSVLDSEGGTLNNPTRQKIGTADFRLAYNWKQIGIETGALNQARGGAQSAADALDLEVTGGLADLRWQVSRQAVQNGDALIAKCATTTTANVVHLDPAGYGYDMIVRGFLHPDLEIDIGTAADPVAVASDRTITAVSENAADPTITISGATVTTGATHFISIHGARNADGTSKEMNGLRNLFGSATTVVGGVDPSVAGNEYWKPAVVDTTSTTLTLDTILALQMSAFQKSGTYPADLITSAKQLANYYSSLQNQVRFTPGSMSAGNVDDTKWNGITPLALVEIPDRELYLVNLRDLILVTGQYSKPTWVSDIEGLNRGMNWVQGTTRFQDAIVYALNLGVTRRNAGAAAVNLTA